MLELCPARASIIRCFGERPALDALPSAGAFAGRVAADELWLVGPPGAANELAERARTYLAGADPDGLVVEHGEAWRIWTLSGSASLEAFSRLADFPFPAGSLAFAQGSVAHLPARVLRSRDRLHVLLPVQVAHHFAKRVIEACDDLHPAVGNEHELEAGPQP